ncbi:hypothetical protein SANA_14540 [Gottschalkiaceae bacterium SANA]|nr:hypothetical protein SANA_14540 [Gottschalkiaceae bacterium SANA]
MANKKLELMKKLIEDKKKISAQQGYKTSQVEAQEAVSTRKAFRNQKSGGLFDR